MPRGIGYKGVGGGREELLHQAVMADLGAHPGRGAVTGLLAEEERKRDRRSQRQSLSPLVVMAVAQLLGGGGADSDRSGDRALPEGGSAGTPATTKSATVTPGQAGAWRSDGGAKGASDGGGLQPGTLEAVRARGRGGRKKVRSGDRALSGGGSVRTPATTKSKTGQAGAWRSGEGTPGASVSEHAGGPVYAHSDAIATAGLGASVASAALPGIGGGFLSTPFAAGLASGGLGLMSGFTGDGAEEEQAKRQLKAARQQAMLDDIDGVTGYLGNRNSEFRQLLASIR